MFYKVPIYHHLQVCVHLSSVVAVERDTTSQQLYMCCHYSTNSVSMYKCLTVWSLDASTVGAIVAGLMALSEKFTDLFV